MKFRIEMADGEIEYMDEKGLKEYTLNISRSYSDHQGFPVNLDSSIVSNQVVLAQWAGDNVVVISDEEYRKNMTNKDKDYIKVNVSVNIDLDLFLSVNGNVCPLEIDRIIKKTLNDKIHSEECPNIVRSIKYKLSDRVSEVVIDKEDLLIKVKTSK